MHVLSFVFQKGGSGKSTMSANVGAGFARRGRKVLIIDADPQGTLTDWRDVGGSEALPPVIGATTVKEIQIALKGAAADGTDIVVVDCPGRAAPLAGAVIAMSDAAILVIQPSAPDIWAASETVQQVKAARKAGQKVSAAFLANRVQPNTRMASEFAKGDWNEHKDIGIMQTTIGNRTAFALAFAQGVSVYEVKGAEAARAEIESLIDELEA